MQPVLFGGYFGAAIHVLPANDVLDADRRGIPRRAGAISGRRRSCVADAVVRRRGRAHGVAASSYKRPRLADAAERRFKWLHTILVNKYGFDWFNEHVIVPVARGCWAAAFWQGRR